MKTKHLVILAAAASASALTALAQDTPTTTMVWDFSTPDNPASVTPTSQNPFNVTGTATIVPGVGAEGYSAGVFLNRPDFYGTATGLWDMLNGSVTIDLVDQLAGTENGMLDYTLVVRHFVSPPPGFPYPSTISFSVPGAQLDSQVAQEVAGLGSWVLSTYSWQQVPVDGLVSLTMSTEANRGLLLDSLSFSVIGELVPIPEPSVAQLGALAALVLGLGSVRRRHNAA
jgi:hypothetical protein